MQASQSTLPRVNSSFRAIESNRTQWHGMECKAMQGDSRQWNRMQCTGWNGMESSRVYFNANGIQGNAKEWESNVILRYLPQFRKIVALSTGCTSLHSTTAVVRTYTMLFLLRLHMPKTFAVFIPVWRLVGQKTPSFPLSATDFYHGKEMDKSTPNLPLSPEI